MLGTIFLDKCKATPTAKASPSVDSVAFAWFVALCCAPDASTGRASTKFGSFLERLIVD